ncbi:MAG: hypothetical protein K9N62_19190 [Verrucomicrobia bacterium]|nr:hypothetical protein [Verrucomicrobiota bacterium]
MCSISKTASPPPYRRIRQSESFKISGARQIVDGDNISYEVVSKSPDMGMQITVRDDGTILGYSAKVRTPEPKGE